MMNMIKSGWHFIDNHFSGVSLNIGFIGLNFDRFPTRDHLSSCQKTAAFLCRDEVEDLLGKGHDQAACQGEKTLGTLGGVMALEGETHLHHAPAQQNQADGTDQGKDEGGEIVHYRQRIAGGKGSGRKAADAQHGGNIGGKPVAALSAKGQGALGIVVLLVVIFLGNPMMQNILQKHSSNSLCSLRLQKVLRVQ